MLVSVVVILDSTSPFQASLACCVSVSRAVPAGICELTLEQAWAVEMKDTPTLELTCVLSNVYTTPSRAVEVTSSPAGYETSVLLVLPAPRNVAYEDGAVSKYPQK